MAKKKDKTIWDTNYEDKIEGDEYAKEEGMEDEPEEHEESSEDLKKEMDEGKKEEDVYTEEGREELTEDDEIDPWEEGYVEGVKGKETLKCRNDGKVIIGKPIERIIDHETYWFCSEKCAENFKKNRSAA